MRQSLTLLAATSQERRRHHGPEGLDQDRLAPVQALDQRAVNGVAEAAGEEDPVADVDLEIDDAGGIAPEDHPERADHAEEERGQAMEAEPLAHQHRSEKRGKAGHDGEDRAGVEPARGAQRLEHAPEEEGQRRAEREIAQKRPGRRPRQPLAPSHDRRHEQRGENEAEAHHHRRVEAVGDVFAQGERGGDDDDDQEGKRVRVRLARARRLGGLRCRLRRFLPHASHYRAHDSGEKP